MFATLLVVLGGPLVLVLWGVLLYGLFTFFGFGPAQAESVAAACVTLTSVGACVALFLRLIRSA